MARKKSGEAEKDNAERWLLTYADMITLLLAYFIVMYASSATDTAKAKAVTMEMIKRFGVLKGSASLMDGKGGTARTSYTFLAGQGDQEIEVEAMEEVLKKRLGERYGEGGLANTVVFGKSERGLVIHLLTDKLLFRVGEAKLLNPVKGILHEIAEVIKTTDKQIVIEGHTCDLPIKDGRYRDNWELSTARAVSVCEHLIKSEKISPKRLSVAGYGQYRPLVPNDDENRRKLNRRVDIIIVKSE